MIFLRLAEPGSNCQLRGAGCLKYLLHYLTWIIYLTKIGLLKFMATAKTTHLHFLLYGFFLEFQFT